MTLAEAADAINFGLAGRVVLVTGGVRGVGAGISSVFAEQGATVITCARRAVDGQPYEFHRCDIRDEDSVKRLVGEIGERHGRLDMLVNNAGGSPYALAAEATHNFHRKIVELNVLAPLLVSQHANVLMQAQPNGGSIVNICSVSGRRPTPGTAAYGAAKAGLENLTTTLAVEWAPKVRVNAVVVGMVETERSELFYGDAESIARVAATVPLGRLARPADIGWAAAFLASDAASYISGATLEVHGGGEPPPYLGASSAKVVERRRVQRDEPVVDPLDLARRAQQPQVRPAVGDHRQIGDIRAQDGPHERHGLAPRAPAGDADGHAAAQLRDGVVKSGSFIGHYDFFTKASRCSSATPARLSSKVKPCSIR